MIIVTGTVTMTPDTEAEMLEISKKHCARSRAEPGCITHNVHTDAEDPMRLVFVEYWEDLAALQAHFRVPESGMFAKRLTELSTTGADMKIFNASEVKTG